MHRMEPSCNCHTAEYTWGEGPGRPAPGEGCMGEVVVPDIWKLQ